MPVVKASFHSVQPSSNARYSVGVVFGLEFGMWAAAMFKLLVGELGKGSTNTYKLNCQRPTVCACPGMISHPAAERPTSPTGGER